MIVAQLGSGVQSLSVGRAVFHRQPGGDVERPLPVDVAGCPISNSQPGQASGEGAHVLLTIPIALLCGLDEAVEVVKPSSDSTPALSSNGLASALAPIEAIAPARSGPCSGRTAAPGCNGRRSSPPERAAALPSRAERSCSSCRDLHDSRLARLGEAVRLVIGAVLGHLHLHVAVALLVQERPARRGALRQGRPSYGTVHLLGPA